MTSDPPTRRDRSRPAAADERGVSELLGGILFFALLLLLLVLAQVVLVPTLNQQIEYEHSQRALDDMGDLQSSTFRVTASGVAETVNFELGVSYPNRPLLLNPAPVQGTIRTTGTSQVTISGITSDNPETDDYWTGAERTFETTSVEYSAPYNEFRGGGQVVFENSAVYAQYSSADVVDGDQVPLVEGNRITIFTLSGDLQESAQSAETLALSPVSAPAQPISVRSVDANQPITITTQTQLDREQWVRILGDEPAVDETAPDDGIQVTGNTLTLTLEPGTYQLRMANVGIGDGVGTASAAYVTRERGFTSQIPVGGGEIAVEVRDQFNNPNSSTDVTYRIVGDTTGSAFFEGSGTDVTTATSDERGRAVATLNATDDGRVTVEATIPDTNDNGQTDEFEKVRFTVQVGAGDTPPGDPGGDAGELNPNRDGRLVLESATTDSDRVTMEFDNRVGTQVTVESVRINAYQPNGPGSSPESFPDYATLVDQAGTTIGDPIPVLGADVPFGNVQVPTDGRTLYAKFYVDSSANDQGKPLCGAGNVAPDDDFLPSEDCLSPVEGGEGFVLTLTYSFTQGGETVTVRSSYLVAPQAAS